MENLVNIKHIAFIMDGNGRWAKKHLLKRSSGHKRGVEIIKGIIDECYLKYGISTVSLFCFSTENWNRSDSEIKTLFDLLGSFLSKEMNCFLKTGIKVRVSGNLEDKRIPKKTLDEINEATKKTKDCKNFVFNVLFNYGGRDEIVNASKKMALDYKEGKISLGEINENTFKNYLYLNGLPDVDLLIRTSGEKRISNCLLYEIAYSEFIFEETYWPDYNVDLLFKNIQEFLKRDRRYGSIKDDQ